MVRERGIYRATPRTTRARAAGTRKPRRKVKNPGIRANTALRGSPTPANRLSQARRDYEGLRVQGLGSGEGPSPRMTADAGAIRDFRLQGRMDAGMSPFGVPFEWQPQDSHPGWIPIYYEGDQLDAPFTSPEDIARLQVELVQAGLLTSAYRRGVWDPATQEAYAMVLTYANQGGEQFGMGPGHRSTAWRKALDMLKENPEAFDEAVPDYVPEVYLAPNPEAIKGAIYNTFNSMLGRDPTELELRQYQGIFENEHRAQYEEAVQRDRTSYYHQAELQGQTDAELTAFGAQGATNRPDMPDGQERDPNAAMNTAILENKQDEREMRTQQQDYSEDFGTLESGFSTLRSMIGRLS